MSESQINEAPSAPETDDTDDTDDDQIEGDRPVFVEVKAKTEMGRRRLGRHWSMQGEKLWVTERAVEVLRSDDFLRVKTLSTKSPAPAREFVLDAPRDPAATRASLDGMDLSSRTFSAKEVRQAIDKALDELRGSFAKETDRVNEEHIEALLDQRQKHREELATVQAKADEAIAHLTAEHAAEIERLKAGFQAELANAKAASAPAPTPPVDVVASDPAAPSGEAEAAPPAAETKKRGK